MKKRIMPLLLLIIQDYNTTLLHITFVRITDNDAIKRATEHFKQINYKCRNGSGSGRLNGVIKAIY